MTASAPASPADPAPHNDPARAVAEGRLGDQGNDDEGNWLDLLVPGTELRLRLRVAQPIAAARGSRIRGEIHARARRVDIVTAGGRFIEPVYGRPRRIQGRIIAGRVRENALVVLAGGVPMVCTLVAPGQRVADFCLHQLASFDVEPGAAFIPQAL